MSGGRSPNLAEYPDLRFPVGFDGTKDQFLFANQLVGGDNARSVQAQHHCARLFGKHTAFAIAADQQDWDRFY